MSKEFIKLYETETGNKIHREQITPYVNWLEKKLSELLPTQECSVPKPRWIASRYQMRKDINQADRIYEHYIQNCKLIDSVLKSYVKKDIEQSDRSLCTQKKIKGNPDNYHLIYDKINIGIVTKTYSRKFNTYTLKFKPRKINHGDNK